MSLADQFAKNNPETTKKFEQVEHSMNVNYNYL